MYQFFLFLEKRDVEMYVMLELMKFDMYNVDMRILTLLSMNYISLYNLSNFLFLDKQLKCLYEFLLCINLRSPFSINNLMI